MPLITILRNRRCLLACLLVLVFCRTMLAAEGTQDVVKSRGIESFVLARAKVVFVTRIKRHDVALLELEHVYLGSLIVQVSFSLDYLRSFEGSSVGILQISPELKLHEVIIVPLRSMYITDKESSLTLTPFLRGRPAEQSPRRESSKTFPQFKELCEEIERLENPILESAVELKKDIEHRNPEIAWWAAHTLGADYPEIAAQKISDNSLSLGARIALDKGLIESKNKNWVASEQRAEFLLNMLKAPKGEGDEDLFVHALGSLERQDVSWRNIIILNDQAASSKSLSMHNRIQCLGYLESMTQTFKLPEYKAEVRKVLKKYEDGDEKELAGYARLAANAMAKREN